MSHHGSCQAGKNWHLLATFKIRSAVHDAGRAGAGTLPVDAKTVLAESPRPQVCREYGLKRHDGRPCAERNDNAGTLACAAAQHGDGIMR